jgi:hypothetical protein
LERYEECIRRLAADAGPENWWLTYQAENRMRSEEFDRILRRLHTERATWQTVNADVGAVLAPFDTSRPWDAVIRAAALKSKDFWDQELVHKVQAFRSSQMDRRPYVEHSTKEVQGYAGGEPSQPKVPWIRDVRQKKTCEGWNSPSGCTTPVEANCPERSTHACSKCGRSNHGAASCWQKGKGSTSGKGKGKEKKGNKGKKDKSDKGKKSVVDKAA